MGLFLLIIFFFGFCYSEQQTEINFFFKNILQGSASNSGSCQGCCSSGNVPRKPSGSCDTEEPRRRRAYEVRHNSAVATASISLDCHENNGDDERYPTRFASFTKGLPHDMIGLVDPAAYNALLNALNSGKFEDFETIPLGSINGRKFVNPQSGLAFELASADVQSFVMPPAPAFASANTAGDIVILYWMALLRDVNFDQFSSNNLVGEAVSDLQKLSDYVGERPINRGTVFRGNRGNLIGPYISQFLYQGAPYGTMDINAKQYPPEKEDFMTEWSEFLSIQNGNHPTRQMRFEHTARYIINGRDLSHYVHFDGATVYQTFFMAFLTLIDGMKVPLKSSIPYQNSATQEGFSTWGSAHLGGLLGQATITALRAQFYSKWFVHRRFRPEAGGGLIDRSFALGNFTMFPWHQDLWNSDVLSKIFANSSSYLLPMAYNEGSPMHPSYGAGHGTVSGVCATLLKAWFQEDYIIHQSVAPNSDGSALVNITTGLRVGDEIDKLAWNIALGRSWAGLHWITESFSSLEFGEKIAVSFLREMKSLYNEPTTTFEFYGFSGNKIIV